MNPNNSGGVDNSGAMNNAYYADGGRGGGAPGGAQPPMMGRGGGGYMPPSLPQQQGYAPMDGGRGRGGYYAPQQQPDQAQMYRGGYAPRGGGGGYGYDNSGGYAQAGAVGMQGYQAQPQQQGYGGGRGGGGAGAAGYPQMMQPGQPQQAMYGGQGQPYPPRQQQPRYAYNPAGPNQGGNPYQQQQGGYYAAPGAYQQQMYPQQQFYGGGYGMGYGMGYGGGYGGRGVGGGGRGARGAGGRGGRGGTGGQRNQSIGFIVHVESFAKLDEIGRRGVMDGVVPQQVIYNMTNLAGFQPVRVLVVVAKKYLAARLSFPKSPDDMLLSEKIVTELLDITTVMNEDGTAVVNNENGSVLPRHLFNQLGLALHVVLPFDKPQPEGDANAVIDLTTMQMADIAREAMTRRAVFEAAVKMLQDDSAASTEFMRNLVTEAFASVLGNTEGGGASGGATGGAPEEDHDDGEDQQQGTHAQPNPTSGDGQAGGKPQARVPLFSAPQGARLLAVAFQSEKKRAAFFDMMRPPKETPTGDTRTLAEELFRVFFTGVFMSRFVFDSFGFTVAAQEANPSLKLHPREVDAICDAFARYGLGVLSNNNGNCTTTALVHKLRPNYVTYENLYKQQRGQRQNAPAGQEETRGAKRGRDEDPADASNNQQQHARTEGGAASGTNNGKDGESAGGVPHAPTNLEKYVPPAPPSDYRFFYAVAAAFYGGDTRALKALTQRRQARAQQQGQQGQQGQGGAPVPETKSAEPEGEETVETRMKLVTQHVIACRSMQVVLPHFADAVLEAEKKKPTTVKHKTFAAECEAILTAVGSQMSTLMAQMYGNYVAQTFIIELAPRAVPGTKVETIFHSVQDVVVENIVTYGMQKFASNCCERAIVASEGVQDGNRFVVRLAKALLDKGDSLVMQVARNAFGNYVVRHLCERLSSYATPESGSDPEVQQSAKTEEKRFFTVLSAHRGDLQSTPYGQGLVAWLDRNSARVQQQA